MLWINYLDTGSERVHTSLEGSFRMEGWRGGGDEEEEHGGKKKAGFKKRFTSERQGEHMGIKVVFTLAFSSLFICRESLIPRTHTPHTWELLPRTTTRFNWCPVSCRREVAMEGGGLFFHLSHFSQDLGNEAVESVSPSRFHVLLS